MLALDAATGLFQALADPSRVRMLAVLAQQELAVAELVEALGLVQSRVSTHLSRLKGAGLVRQVRDGAALRWAVDLAAMPPSARRLWEVAAAEIDDATLAADAARATAVVRRRHEARGGAWPDAVAGEMERHYSPGRTWEAMARALALASELGDVLDVGAGDGTIASLLAPSARSYTCLDKSERMTRAARERLRSVPGVRVVSGDVAAMPLPAAGFDLVLALNVLTCVARPDAALSEIARVLRPGGRAVVATLAAHTHPELTARYGHVHAGFTPRALARLVAGAGLEVRSCAVTSRERREPRFEVVTASALKEAARAPAEKTPLPAKKKERKP